MEASKEELLAEIIQYFELEFWDDPTLEGFPEYVATLKAFRAYVTNLEAQAAVDVERMEKATVLINNLIAERDGLRKRCEELEQKVRRFADVTAELAEAEDHD